MKIKLDGKELDFTCKTEKFKTDIDSGHKHREEHDYRGSAIKGSVYEDSDYSLWIEHVVEIKKPDNKVFWFMWYNNKSGKPLLTMSAVFSKNDLLKVLNNIDIKINIIDIDFK